MCSCTICSMHYVMKYILLNAVLNAGCGHTCSCRFGPPGPPRSGSPQPSAAAPPAAPAGCMGPDSSATAGTARVNTGTKVMHQGSLIHIHLDISRQPKGTPHDAIPSLTKKIWNFAEFLQEPFPAAALLPPVLAQAKEPSTPVVSQNLMHS